MGGGCDLGMGRGSRVRNGRNGEMAGSCEVVTVRGEVGTGLAVWRGFGRAYWDQRLTADRSSIEGDSMNNQPQAYVHDGREFHLTNGLVSYVMRANDQGKLLHLYYGAAVTDRDDFSHLIETQRRSTASCPVEGK